MHIKWNSLLSDQIHIVKGTKQGGLTSPFLFNLFYEPLVDTLNRSECGICINNATYNVFCYADDLLLMSTTTVGLQRLINTSDTYIKSHGLNFNPSKTNCITFGKSNLTEMPTFMLGGFVLGEEPHISYLGITLSKSSDRFVQERIKSCRRAYHALQGVGLCKGAAPVTSTELWKTMVRPVLTYGLQCVSYSGKCARELEKTQASLIKAFIGVYKSSRSSPLLGALSIHKIKTSVAVAEMRLLCSLMHNTSKAKLFYSHILSELVHGRMYKGNLVNRVKSNCAINNINMFKYIFYKDYSTVINKKIKHLECNGHTDSIRNLIMNFKQENIYTLNLLLKSF